MLIGILCANPYSFQLTPPLALYWNEYMWCMCSAALAAS
jgi:hypothetical protein